MGSTSINIPGMGAPATPKEEREVYNGPISFGKRTLSFQGSVLLRQNISRIDKYRIPPDYKLSLALLLLALVICVVALSLSMNALAFIAFLVLIAGIVERFVKKDGHGLTIEMNSGYRKIFLSRDIQGINQLFGRIQDALENGKELEVNWNFAEVRVGKINYTNISNRDGIVQNVVDSPEARVGAHIQKDDLATLTQALKTHGVSSGQIDELVQILNNQPADKAMKQMNEPLKGWIRRTAGSLPGIALESAIGTITGLLFKYFGWG